MNRRSFLKGLGLLVAAPTAAVAALKTIGKRQWVKPQLTELPKRMGEFSYDPLKYQGEWTWRYIDEPIPRYEIVGSEAQGFNLIIHGAEVRSGVNNEWITPS